MAGFRVKRNCAGSYEVGVSFDRQKDYVASILYSPEMKGWIASATWDRYLYSDPVETYRRAKQTAFSMLRDLVARDFKELRV